MAASFIAHLYISGRYMIPLKNKEKIEKFMKKFLVKISDYVAMKIRICIYIQKKKLYSNGVYNFTS